MQFGFALFVLGVGWLFAQPTAFDLRPSPGARLALTVEKTGLWSGRKHVFEFRTYKGVLRYDGANPSRSEVELEIEGGSAVCTDTWLSEKDRAKVLAFLFHDMLDVERHPRLIFKSKGVVKTGEKAFEVAGVLTVRGLERPATVVVTIDDPARIGAVSGRATIRLKDYGLQPPKAALGAIGTKDEMTFEFRLPIR